MPCNDVRILGFPPTPGASGSWLAQSKSLVRRGRGTIRQAPEDAADYKSAPLPIRVTPPYQRADALQAHWRSLETPLGVEPSSLPLLRKRLAVCLRGLWLHFWVRAVMISTAPRLTCREIQLV